MFPHNFSFAEDQTQKIGVLAFRGESNALKRWSATAEYLSEKIKGHTFSMVPLNLDNIDLAIQNAEIDFVLTNAGNYVNHEANDGINRIATVKTLRQGQPYTKFGAVIFTRSDRQDINTLADLKDKSFMAVKKDAFGGFQMAWRELKAHAIDPFSDFSELRFNGFPQDSIVYAVKDGIVDAGTIRTDLLEKMAVEGKINLRTFRILNRKKTDSFPFIHSTQLYPEWPLAKLKHTSGNLAQQVVVALLNMPAEHASAKTAKIGGWIIPLDYQPVREMMQELQVGPYKNLDKITISEFFKQHQLLIIISVIVILLFIPVLIMALVLNRRLLKSNHKFDQEIKQRQQIENVSTRLGRILDTAYDDIFIIDAQTLKIVQVNQTAINNLGYTPSELNEMTLLGIKQDMSHQKLEELLKPLRTGEKKSVSHETKHYRKDGTAHHIEGHIQLFDSESPPVFVGVAHKIDDRINIEKLLISENAKINNILECTNDAYFTLDKEWNISYINSKAEQLFQTRRELLLGKNIWDEIPELGSSFFKTFNKSMLNNEPQAVEGYYPPLNKWVDAHTYPSANGLTVYLRDKTNEKLIIENLNKKNINMETIMSSVSDGIVTVNSYGSVISFNHAAEEIFGYAADEIIGNNINILVPDHLKQKHDEIITQVRHQGDAYIKEMNRTVIGQKKDGSIVNLSLAINNLSSGDDNSYVGIFRDIAEHKAEIINLQIRQNESN